MNRFVEKPDVANTQDYVASGDYFWNSGLFLFRAGRYLEELARFRPDILDACRKALAGGKEELHFTRVDRDAFAACPADSIDYAVMERTADAVMVPLAAGWSDIGWWSALWEVSARDAEGNVFRGDVLGEATALVTENPSTYLPIGRIHALENPGRIPLELIEVQSGSYVREKDIVRFEEERYGRA